MNRQQYILNLKNLRSIINEKIYDITTQQDFRNIKDNLGSGLYQIITYMLKDRFKIITGKDAGNLKVKELMSIVRRYTPRYIKDKVEIYYAEVHNSKKYNKFVPDELKRRNKILKYIYRYEELQDQIKHAEDNYKKAVEERKQNEQNIKGKRDNLYKDSGEIHRAETALRNKSIEFYYLAIAGLVVSLAFILIFAYDAFEGIKNAFKEFFNFNNSLEDRLLFALKGVGWCSLILLPIAITIYFFLKYLDYKRQSNNMSEEGSNVSERIKDSYTKLDNLNDNVSDCINTLNNLRHELKELINSNESLYII